MEYHAPENVIELAKSINRAIDSSTKPLHTAIEKLVVELDTAYKVQGGKSQEIKQLKAENERLRKDGLSLANGAVTYRQEIEKYKEALEHIIEYWNKDKNHGAMSDALDEILNTAEQALKGGEKCSGT